MTDSFTDKKGSSAKFDVLRCQNCGRLALALEGNRVSTHKCAGMWTEVGSVSVDRDNLAEALVGLDFNHRATGRVRIDYTNWRGERRVRQIEPPMRLAFGSTEHHPEPQWFVVARDVEKFEMRTFALKSIHEWDVAAPFER